uniref:Uncharacterized protein n=1 Tax=Cacopsylla melanoneura TaxID=428564 RepID=A0A8D8UC58_9HEMI
MINDLADSATSKADESVQKFSKIIRNDRLFLENPAEIVSKDALEEPQATFFKYHSLKCRFIGNSFLINFSSPARKKLAIDQKGLRDRPVAHPWSTQSSKMSSGLSHARGRKIQFLLL